MNQVRIARIFLISAAVVSLILTPMNGGRRLMDVPENLLRTKLITSKDVKGHDEEYIDSKAKTVGEVVPLEKGNKKEDEIRYASFGSSVTWGAALEDRENEAYAWRLSNFDRKKAKNYGIRATGPNYPAACISTMIGEEVFDVIVLEYFCRGPEGLMTLATRIRERFPNAIIIMIKLWSPFQLRDDSVNKNVADFAFDNGFKRDFIHDPKFKEVILSYGADKFKYQYRDPENELTHLFKTVAEKIGAHVVNMPFSKEADGPNGWLELGDKLLGNDSFHLSAKGHEDLAKQIKAVVHKIGVPKDAVIGKFHGIDHCHNWIESGVIGKGLKYSSNGRLYKMKNTEKYVLSFFSDDEKKESSGWIKVSNPSDTEMDLFLAYMTTGPAPSKYPRVEVVRTSNFKKKYVLDPDALGWGDKHVHIARIEHIGKLDAGVKHEMVTFRPLDEAEYPFRLVAAVITPINENNDEAFAGIGNGN